MESPAYLKSTLVLLMSGDITTRADRECPVIEPQRRYIPHPGTEVACNTQCNDSGPKASILHARLALRLRYL